MIFLQYEFIGAQVDEEQGAWVGTSLLIRDLLPDEVIKS